MILRTEMVPRYASYLWDARVPQHCLGETQDACMEVYSPPRVSPFVERLGLAGGLSADILTGWNFNNIDTRIAMVVEVKVRRPQVLILSPPCTWFSTLQNLNWYKIPVDHREQKLCEAILHVEFCCMLMRLQVQGGRKVIFEHPKSALSFKFVKQLKEFVDAEGFMNLDIDQCLFGLVSPKKHMPLKKATLVLTNLQELKPYLQGKKCHGGHQHKPILGSEGGVSLSKHAQIYPEGLCKVFAQAIAQHARR